MGILLQEAIVVILLLSGLPLLACSATGLIVSLMQAVTQVQEQTITYCTKVITLLVVMVVFSEWSVATIQTFSLQIFESIARIGK